MVFEPREPFLLNAPQILTLTWVVETLLFPYNIFGANAKPISYMQTASPIPDGPFSLGPTVPNASHIYPLTQITSLHALILCLFSLIFLDKRSLSFRDAIAVRVVYLPPGSDRSCEVLKNVDSRIPVNAGVGDANAPLQTRWALRRYLLVAFVDVGLDHYTNDGLLSLSELVGDDLGDLGLVSVILVRVTCSFVSFDCNLLIIVLRTPTMRAVNHNG